MELKEFVTETINQIAEGARDANKHIQSINKYHRIDESKPVQISFDVAVAVEDTGTSGVGGKLKVAEIFSFGGDSTQTSKNLTSNRVSFTVCVNLDTYEKSFIV